MHQEREFGLLLRQHRLAADLTQEALAEQVGCAAQTIRAFESGRRRPSRDMAARLADILRVQPDLRADFIRLARASISAPPSETAIAMPDSAAASFSPFIPSDTLIGRRTDLERVRVLICETRRRLVTLLGAGGVGKTRLARQAADNLGAQFRDGKAFVALAAVLDFDDVVTTIAGTLGIQLGGQTDAATALVHGLRDRDMLLVLDNLEQLLGPDIGEQVLNLIGRILAEAPGVFVLTTSRERLRLQAEAVAELGGLQVPDDDAPERIARSDAVMLFVDRARSTTGDFVLGPANQQIVAQICRRLDGLPLAIELAAAQLSFVSPAALLARLDRALPILEGGARDLPQRQRTMRATIEWSYNLLKPGERMLFERLGVLLDSWTLEAAEAIGGADAISHGQVLALLRRLADQSLLNRVASEGDEVRFRMLEPVRQFALERLEQRGAEAEAARARHAAFYTRLSDSVFGLLRGPEQVYWLARLEREYANLHAAITWLLSKGEYATVAHLGYALWVFLWVRGHFRAGRHWMAQVLAHLPQQPTLARAHARLTASVLAYGQAEYDIAAPLAEESLADYQAVAHEEGIGYGLSMIGLIAAGQGRDERATRYMADAVAIMRRLGDASNIWSAAMVLNYWAPIPFRQGDYVETARLAQQALELARAIGDRIGAYSALYLLALVGQATGDARLARRRFDEALQLALELGDLGNAVACLEGLAGGAVEQRDYGRAACLLAAAAAARASGEAAQYAYTQSGEAVERALATVRSRLTTAEFHEAWAAGQRMSLQQAAHYALSA